MVGYTTKSHESWMGIYVEENGGWEGMPGQRDGCDQTLLDTCVKVSKKSKNK